MKVSVTSVPFFIPAFNFLSFDIDSFTISKCYITILKHYIESFYIDIILKQNKIVEHTIRSKTLATRARRAKSYGNI